MARLHEPSDSEDELPELLEILIAPKSSRGRAQSKYASPRKEQTTTNGQPVVSPRAEDAINTQKGLSSVRSTVTVSIGDRQARKQKPLRLAHVNSLLLPTANLFSKSPVILESLQQKHGNDGHVKDTRRLAATQKVDYSTFVTDLQDTLELTEEEASFDDLSDFLVDDSVSEEELKRPRSAARRSPKKSERNRQTIQPLGDARLGRGLKEGSAIIDLISPEKDPAVVSVSVKSKTSIKDNDENTFNVDPCATLRFSPPRSKSPYKLPEAARFVTPPPSPSKLKLQSPTKSKPRVPPSPHRPSLDAFWSADVINDWNDQYSPKKTPQPRRLFPVDEDDEGHISPSGSPRKSPMKSPKKDKQAIERKKKFDIEKHALASTFLAELDQTVAEGKVASLASSTGGIQIIWSKKLHSTAGRANWKREAIRTKNADGTTASTTYRHHASIELAEKVIDDEDRLLNVLAHEYCHLANFMLSNVKDAPHGKAFKAWASKVSTAFAHRSIRVTTKHSYTIAYKYAWACTVCALAFQRHSRSIDPARHTCGACKGVLVQTQPPPRGADGRKVLGGYQAYVKENYQRVKGECGGKGMGEVMRVLGRGYRDGKGREENGERGKEGEGGVGGELDAVARKLDFLSLDGAKVERGLVEVAGR